MAILGAGVRAEENASVEAYYPEGPLRWGDTLYFAEMHKDRVVSLTNEVPDTFYQHDGCGPTAIATYADGFVVLCHLPNELHQISASGAFADKFDRDESGAAFRNPNDASSDDAGGVYFTASGVFSLNAPREGALLYLAKDGKITRLASNLHYANGVYFDAAQQAVFLSEHFAQRVLRFPVVAPGELGPPEVFANLPVASLGKTVPYERAGPDGLETDADGNLYVAYYGAGLVLALSPEGEMTGRVDINEMLTTNVTLSADENSLFVTGSRISSRKPFPGMVRTMNNPLAKRDIER
jgi:sugar lactone lactonase YvrE